MRQEGMRLQNIKSYIKPSCWFKKPKCSMWSWKHRVFFWGKFIFFVEKHFKKNLKRDRREKHEELGIATWKNYFCTSSVAYWEISVYPTDENINSILYLTYLTWQYANIQPSSINISFSSLKLMFKSMP